MRIGRLLRGVLPLALVFLAGCPKEAPPSRDILRLEEDGFLYSFHVITGTDSLYDLDQDPRCLRNLATERPAVVARMREALEKQLGVPDLEVWRRQRIAEYQAGHPGEVVR